ncbi:Crp/Fnr family transcriptional regulator [Ulvibacter antarcticus]|uniref:CRP-like cAMP-binding protein n=1 Tax=Ulvibacter antarcticus TaxID=442714 RepID=A0A3L9YXL1_9FLAO|nr:Crp/Fnr family transcriptional regulator [Ulvibacter antarcticus]RMA64570.1 CRP-like cAMP-binding protein [Ulvibacter antarcticus]
MIPENLLETYGAECLQYGENELIFSEKRRADFYFQIKAGEVKMFNLSENGKEFLQGMFFTGESFGEPPLFGDFKYPATAITLGSSKIYRLPKAKLMELLKSNFNLHLKVTETLAKRLKYKSMIMKEISVHPPEHRILTLVDFLKKQYGDETMYKVELTRQQIADLTGLRVETVIRAFKSLESEGEIEIRNHKIFR